jgi:hypothetical protein
MSTRTAAPVDERAVEILVSQAGRTDQAPWPGERSVSTSTPWGRADFAVTFARGVTSYVTPSHGGFKLSAGRLDTMPYYIAERPDACRFSGPEWFEEDCEAHLVVVSFPELFSPQHIAHSVRGVAMWFPEIWLRLEAELLADITE